VGGSSCLGSTALPVRYRKIEHMNFFSSSSPSTPTAGYFVLCPGHAFDSVRRAVRALASKLACLYAVWQASSLSALRQEGIPGSIFGSTVRVHGDHGDFPSITGSATSTAMTLILDPEDPFSYGDLEMTRTYDANHRSGHESRTGSLT